MRVDKSKVRAPEIGRVWLHSPAVSLRPLWGKIHADRFCVDGQWAWTAESIESGREIERPMVLKSLSGVAS
jgi:hypothetical protein